MCKINQTLGFLQTFAEEHKDWTYTMAAVGAVYVGHQLLKAVHSTYKYTLRPSKDLKKRYGDGWALITGATNATGRAFANELARRGFKVGLIDSDKEKLDLLSEEIKASHNVETLSFEFDPSQAFTNEVLEGLKEKLEVFDTISMLINNAEYTIQKGFAELETEEINGLFNTNIAYPTHLSKLVIPKMLERKERGAIINIGSEETEFLAQSNGLFTSSKSYLTYLSHCLDKEYKDKIDVMVTSLGPTNTDDKKAVEVLSTTPESVAKHTLDTVGWESQTHGDYKHALRSHHLKKFGTGRMIRRIDRKRNLRQQI